MTGRADDEQVCANLLSVEGCNDKIEPARPAIS